MTTKADETESAVSRALGTGLTPQLMLSKAHRGVSSVFWKLSGLVTIFIGWWVASFFMQNPLILPGPVPTAERAWTLLLDGGLLSNAGSSLLRVLEGWSIASVVAIALGTALHSYLPVRRIVLPIIELFRPIPPIAMVPLAILWLGIGEVSQVSIVVYGSVLPMIIGVYDSVTNVDSIYTHAAQSLGSKGFALFKVKVMTAIPGVISTLRLGLGLAFVSLVAAELIGASSGLGALISQARVNFETRDVLVGIAAVGVVGFLLSWSMKKVENLLVKW